jgi:hypothetical protein
MRVLLPVVLFTLLVFSHATYLLIDNEHFYTVDVATGKLTETKTGTHYVAPFYSPTVDIENKRLFWKRSTFQRYLGWFDTIYGFSFSAVKNYNSTTYDEKDLIVHELYYDNKRTKLYAVVYSNGISNTHEVTEQGSELILSPTIATLDLTGYFDYIGYNEVNHSLLVLSYNNGTSRRAGLVTYDIDSGKIIKWVDSQVTHKPFSQIFVNTAADKAVIIDASDQYNGTYTLSELCLSTGKLSLKNIIYDSNSFDVHFTYSDQKNELVMVFAMSQYLAPIKTGIYVFDASTGDLKSKTIVDYIEVKLIKYLPF